MHGRLNSQQGRTVLALAALAIVACLANLWKPFHIDDTAHLVIAQWIADNPLHPMSGLLNWIGVDEPIHRTNQPHLFFYLMAGWGRLFGWSEIAQHALLALASAACVALMWRLSRRVVPEHALWVTALLILSPAFIVSQNMMVDVPLLACWLWFFDALLATDEAGERRGGAYLSAALGACCAVLFKYISLTLLPILAAVVAWDRRWRMLILVAVPLAALGLWSAFNIADYGGIHILQRGGGSQDLLRPLKFAVAWVLIVGGVTPIGLAWAASNPRFGRWGVLAAAVSGLVLGLATIMVAVGVISDAVADPVLWVLFAINGGLAAIALAVAAWPVLPLLLRPAKVTAEGRMVLILLAWIAGGAGFYILLAPFSAVRHALTVLPAILLLVVFTVRGSIGCRTKTIALVVSALISGAIAVSDFRFAQFYKTGAIEVARELADAPAQADRTIWTSGHWGWQWYAAQQGFRQIDYRTSLPGSGDYFVEAVGVDRQYPKERLDLELVGSIVQPPSALSLFCTARPRRFYLSSSRYGPWSLSMDCTQRIDIYRVR